MSNDAKSPGPNAPSDAQIEVHPGWVRSGQDCTPGQKAYYINLEATPGNGDKVEQFLRDILAGVEQEPGTGPWFGTRFSDTTFGIFEAFPDAAARNAHDVGPGGQNFLRSSRTGRDAGLSRTRLSPRRPVRKIQHFVRKEDCLRAMG